MEKNAIGTHRQTLRLNGQEFKVDQAEQKSLAVFLTALRRTRYWKHETWCDPKVHAQTADGEQLDETPCVGRLVTNDGLGGWWTQDEVGGEAYFVVDTQGSWTPTASDLQTVSHLLSTGSKQQLWGLVDAALGEFEWGVRDGKQS